jgi:hypothetical protein
MDEQIEAALMHAGAQISALQAIERRLCAELQKERQKTERIRVLVEAVRDANAASQDSDDCLIYTPALDRAWTALMAGLEGPTAPEREPT